MGEYFVHLLHILTFIQSVHRILMHPKYGRTFGDNFFCFFTNIAIFFIAIKSKKEGGTIVAVSKVGIAMTYDRDPKNKNLMQREMCQKGTTLDHDFYFVVGKQCRTETYYERKIIIK